MSPMRSGNVFSGRVAIVSRTKRVRNESKKLAAREGWQRTFGRRRTKRAVEVVLDEPEPDLENDAPTYCPNCGNVVRDA